MGDVITPVAAGQLLRVVSPTGAGLALGTAADLLLADPRRGHPVAGFGQLAAALERRVWHDDRAAGAASAGGLVAATAAHGIALGRGTRHRPVARTAVTAAVTWTVLGGTSLGRAASTLQRHIADGDLPAARAAPRRPAPGGPPAPRCPSSPAATRAASTSPSSPAPPSSPSPRTPPTP